MANWKCAQCGLINFASAEVCRRCAAAAASAQTAPPPPPSAPPAEVDLDSEPADALPPRRSIIRRVGVSVGVAALILLFFYISLLESSAPVSYDQKVMVGRAIDLIEQKGFARDAFLLRRLASFRTTDNWWNRWLGHQDAYAATNFPFEVVTLYPEFFKYPADDIERAVVLLHEARHLAGAGEEKAFATVWRDKARLGWTKEQYGQTRVWKNVNEFTLKYAPAAQQCGDAAPDCAD